MLPVKNHGIPENLIFDGLDAAKQFFALPEASKKQVSTQIDIPALDNVFLPPPPGNSQLDIHNSPAFKGYTALLGENTDPANRGDLHEAFDIGWEPEEGSPAIARADGAMAGANVWPQGVPGFKAAVLAY